MANKRTAINWDNGACRVIASTRGEVDARASNILGTANALNWNTSDNLVAISAQSLGHHLGCKWSWRKSIDENVVGAQAARQVARQLV